jgi:hypothetical protein
MVGKHQNPTIMGALTQTAKAEVNLSAKPAGALDTTLDDSSKGCSLHWLH